MATPRVSLNALRAFEATARLHSFSAAADELSVTHGAVSRQVRMLEERFGVSLLQRTAQGAAARVNVNQWLGDQSHIGATLGDRPLVLVEHERSAVQVGESIGVHFPANDLHVFDANSGQAITHGQEIA